MRNTEAASTLRTAAWTHAQALAVLPTVAL